MAAKGSLVVKFIGDTRDFERANKRMSGIVGKAGKTLGAAFAGVSAVNFIKGTIQQASELEQSIGGVRAVFGKYADGVERDSKRAAKALGLSRNAYNELITVSGAMLKNKGIANFAGQSEKLIKTGADLAAQFGGSTKDAVDALNAAMRGESDPIERYGISLNEAAIKAELAARGQDKLKGAALEQAKTMARLRLITKQSADAHGAFARESGTLAGKQARLKATWENLTTQLGTKLLPVVADGVTHLSKFVDGMDKGTGAGGKFVDVLEDARDVGKAVARFFDSLPGPVKKYGVELLIAAVALRKLSAVTSSFGASLASPIAKTKQLAAEMTYAETRMQRVGAAGRALGAGLRNLAGMGGMLLLAKGMGQADQQTKTLQTTLGAAAVGFGVGGPIGGAVGALGGFMVSLAGKTETAGEAWRAARDKAYQFGSTLDTVTGKITKNTEATIINALQSQTAALPAAQALGLSQKQLAGYIMGLPGPVKAVNKAMREGALASKMMTYENGGQALAWQVLDQALNGAKGGSAGITQTFRKQAKEARENAKRGRELAAAMKGVPTKVATRITAQGADIGIRHLEAFIDRTKRTPKQVRTLVKALGVDVTKAQLKTLMDRTRTLGQMVARPKVEVNSWGAFKTLAEIGRRLENLGKKRGRGSKASSGSERLMDPAGMARAGRSAGRAYGDGLLKGLLHKQMAVSKAVDKIRDLAAGVASKLADLRSTRAEFTSTFSADSIFGADLETTGKSLGGLLAFQQQQASKAAQLAADVQAVIGKGLSKSLVAQLQAAGSAGAEQLHLLAGASAAQISQFNALNAQTSASLSAAGLLAGNTVRGGSIDADIKRAQKQDKVLDEMLKLLKRLDGDTVIQIDSETFIKVIKRRNKRKGVATAGM